MRLYKWTLLTALLLVSSLSGYAATLDKEMVSEVVKNVEQEKTKIAEQVSERPDEWRGPTTVKFVGFILDIDGIDDANQNFESNVYVQLKWNDRRLADFNAKTKHIPLENVWNPRILITNQQGRLNTALPEIVQVEPDGTVIYRQRYTGKLSQPMELSHFPMDKHLFTIQFAGAGYSDQELEFVPDIIRNLEGGGIADILSLPDWRVTNFEAKASSYQPIKEISSAGFVLQFEATRNFSYYIWQIILPLSVVIIMSWASFWISRDQLGVRIGVATSSILTLIAHRFVLASLLPRLPYMTKLDYFSIMGTLLVLLALIVVVVGALLTQKEQNKYIAQRIDLCSRCLFPLAYFMLLFYFIVM